MNDKADKPDESEVSAELARTIIVPPRGSSHGVIEAQYGALLARSEARERERALVYESSAAAATTTTEAEAILELEPVFTALEEPVLYALAHDDEAVGPRVGNPDVPETTLKALAGYEWESRTRHVEHRRWRFERVLFPIAALVLGYTLRSIFG